MIYKRSLGSPALTNICRCPECPTISPKLLMLLATPQCVSRGTGSNWAVWPAGARNGIRVPPSPPHTSPSMLMPWARGIGVVLHEAYRRSRRERPLAVAVEGDGPDNGLWKVSSRWEYPVTWNDPLLNSLKAMAHASGWAREKR